jgi:outer membrane receptor protein involved in Fe transport
MMKQLERNFCGWGIGILFLLIFPLTNQAQSTSELQVEILDSATFLPIGSATATLLKQESQVVVRESQTKDDGKLLFQQLTAGLYTLRISFVGYDTKELKNLQVQAGKTLDVGKVMIRESVQMLDEISIVAEKPAMELAVDRKIFNVAESMVSVGGSASELLANIPSLQVDMDGNVSLRGSSSVRILIDGKESAMAGNNIAQLLQSLPANSIERVEVVTNPSSKYDAEGQSGIINIVMKKNVRTGLNGSLNLNGGSYRNFGGGLDLNYRDKRFNYFGNYSLNRRRNLGDGTNSTQLLSNNSFTDNISESNRRNLNHSLKFGVDYYATEKTTLSLSGNINVRGGNGREEMLYSYRNHPVFSGNSLRNTTNEDNNLGFDVNADFKREYGEGEELTANASFGRGNRDGNNTYFQSFSNGIYPDRRINESEEQGRNINLQLDYVRPINDNSKFEAGYRSIIRLTDDHQFSRLADSLDILQPDYNVSNDFEMQSQVHALYSNYQKKFDNGFGFQLGLRAEQAYLNTNYIGLDPTKPIGDQSAKGQLDYFRVYPSLFLTQQLGDLDQVQVSYTRRVNRPRGWQVNPFIDMSDPMNIRQGNPNLMPEDIHSFETSYARNMDKMTITSSVYHRLMNDVVQSIMTTVEGNSGATFSQWDNISRNETTGAELISRFNFSRAWDLTANVNAFYSAFKGSEKHQIAPTEGFSWNVNTTTNLRFIPNVSMQARFEYQAPRIMAQGKTLGNYIVDAGVKWDVLNKKGSVMFNARDLLNQRRHGGYTATSQIYRSYENRWMRRTFTLAFSYRFGNSDFQRKERPRDMSEFGGEGEMF